MVNAAALHSSAHRRLSVPTASQLLRSRAATALAPLVPADTLSMLIALADQFAAPVLTACCECRLGADDGRIDLALCLLPASDDRTGLALDACNDAGWAASMTFLRDWSAFQSDLTSAIPFVWVAFDLERAQTRLPIPCLGLCVDPNFLPRRLGLSFPGTEPALDPIALATRTHHALWNSALPARTRELMLRALSGTGVTAKHFSYMSSRATAGSAPFKLDVRVHTAALEHFLDQLGWPGPNARIAKRVRELAAEQTELQLNLVLEPELSQPLEVELLTDPTQVTAAERRALLERLVDAGLCSSDKAEVLRRVSSERAAEDPAGVSWYVKVRMQDDRPSEAKAYVGITPRYTWK